MNENTRMYKSLYVFIRFIKLKIYYISQCITLMREDEVDGMSEPQKKKKHKKGEPSSESAECDVMANIVEQEEIEPVLGKSIRKERGMLRMKEGQVQRERRR